MDLSGLDRHPRRVDSPLFSAGVLGIVLLLGGCGDDGGVKIDTNTPAGGASPSATAAQFTPTAIASPSPSPTVRATPGSKYTVKAGDTLWDLALEWGVTIDAITSANNLGSPDDLTIGQELTVP